MLSPIELSCEGGRVLSPTAELRNTWSIVEEVEGSDDAIVEGFDDAIVESSCNDNSCKRSRALAY